MDEILSKFGVDLNHRKFRGNKKWSERIKDTFLDQGKPWNDDISKSVKHTVASLISKQPKKVLNEHKRNSIDALCCALEKIIEI
jgi:hypothetical protein